METDFGQRYLELLKKTLVDYYHVGQSEYKPIGLVVTKPTWKTQVLLWMDAVLRRKKFAVCKQFDVKEEDRAEGKDWPMYADSMIGLKRLDNIQTCIEGALADGVPGDLIETGVWRGGATIFMKAVLDAHNITDRRVWCADSFEGLPKPNEETYVADKGDTHHTRKELSVSLDEVKKNFEKYGLLDENVVKFLPGWFKDTLPTAPIKKLALLRLDGDMYESTMEALTHLYPKLSPGGYLIIDDWFLKGCRKAILDYREANGITEEIIPIDSMSAYWKKK